MMAWAVPWTQSGSSPSLREFNIDDDDEEEEEGEEEH